MRLCVLIPARNEALVLPATLRSVLASVPAENIYVIDDGSSDHTRTVAAGFGVNVLSNPVNLGKAASVRRGTAEFELTRRYDIISMMDSDTQIGEGYFEMIRESFEANPAASAICGSVKSRRHNWITAYRTLQYFISDTVFKAGQSELGTITVAAGCSTSYRAAAFAQLEWTNDTVTEDMDVTIQIYRKRLGPILYKPSARVITQDPFALKDYGKQIWRWNTGAWQVGRKHSMWGGLSKIDLEFQLLMGEGLLFSTLMIASPLGMLLYPKLAYPLVLDVLVYVLLSLACAIREGRPDVLLYSPLFVMLRFLDALVFLSSFVAAVVLRKADTNWNAVRRYPVWEEVEKQQ